MDTFARKSGSTAWDDVQLDCMCMERKGHVRKKLTVTFIAVGQEKNFEDGDEVDKNENFDERTARRSWIRRNSHQRSGNVERERCRGTKSVDPEKSGVNPEAMRGDWNHYRTDAVCTNTTA